MHNQTIGNVPLLGALLIVSGRITIEQLEACLLVQRQDHPDLPIGEILVRCGYISKEHLERALAEQRDMRSALTVGVSVHAPPTADLTALVVAREPDRALARRLQALGVNALHVDSAAAIDSCWGTISPDLVLFEPACLDLITRIRPAPETVVAVLPRSDDEDAAAPSAEVENALLNQYVAQARAHAHGQRAAEQLQQREFDLRMLDTVIKGVARANDPDVARITLMSLVRDVMGVEAGTFFRLDRERAELVFEVVLGPCHEELYQKRLPVDRGIAGWVVRHGEPLLIPDVQRDPRFEHTFDRRTGFQTRSVLCVPLIAEGEVCGVLQLLNKLNGDFSEHDLQMLRVVAAVGALLQRNEELAGCARQLG